MGFQSLVGVRDQATISRISCKGLLIRLNIFSANEPRFENSVVTNSSNGLRIKTDFNATGSVENVTFSNITLSNIKNYGIDIQQDYLNGGSSGVATNGVRVADINFSKISGWVVPAAMDYYILCGNGSCTDFRFYEVNVRGGSKPSSCNYPPKGCPSL
jgi:polygalacturonase